ncbi:MAG: hypothetical protein ACOC0V_05800, partial [Oceanicaulis sp.]
EPNGADLGRDGVWPGFARRIADRVIESRAGLETPLLLSPDRWARAERAEELDAALAPGGVTVLHDYDPWAYTHQEGGGVRFDPAGPEPVIAGGGDTAVLEFGAVRRAPEIERYLQSRIDAFERAGANWSVFRWTSGWAPYERQEGAMAVSEHERALGVLRSAWRRNSARPA